MAENTKSLLGEDYVYDKQRLLNVQMNMIDEAIGYFRHDHDTEAKAKLIGIAGMVASGIKGAYDANRYFKAKNGISRAIEQTYIDAAESVGDFSNGFSLLKDKELPSSYERYVKAKEAYDVAVKLEKTGATANVSQLNKELLEARKDLAKRMSVEAIEGRQDLFQPQRALLDRAKALEAVVRNDGYVNASQLVGHADEMEVFNQMKYADEFDNILQRGKMIEANPKLKTSAAAKFWKSGGKGVLGFGAAYFFYELGEMKEEEMNSEAVAVAEALYSKAIQAADTIPDEYDYMHMPEERKALVEWALANTTDETEKEMLIDLKDKHDCDFYEYLVEEKGISYPFLVGLDHETTKAVAAMMVGHAASNINGSFFSQLEEARHQQQLEKENTQETEKTQTAESSVSKTLSEAANAPEETVEAQPARAWQAEEVKDDEGARPVQSAEKTY